jgi:hypothetical protein
MAAGTGGTTGRSFEEELEYRLSEIRQRDEANPSGLQMRACTVHRPGQPRPSCELCSLFTSVADATYYLGPEPPPSVEELGWRFQSREDWLEARQTTEACVTMLEDAEIEREFHARDLALMALNNGVETCVLATKKSLETVSDRACTGDTRH